MNLIGVLMNKKNLSMQQAFDEVGSICRNFIIEYLTSKGKLLEEFNDSETKRIFEFYDCILSAALHFQLLSKRYSDDGVAIKESHAIKILKKNIKWKIKNLF